MQRLCGLTISVSILSALAVPARALPPVQSQANMTDETRVELQVLGQAIREDRVSWCQLSLRVTGDVAPLTAGDGVVVEVYEDDAPLWDDLLWETAFTTSAAEASAGRIERSFDCSCYFGDDMGSFFEVYATATVQKSASATEELAETPLLDVQIVDDDFVEDDDTWVRPTLLYGADAPNRICRDEDWFSFTLTGPAAVSVAVSHLTAAGRLDVALRDAGLNLLTYGHDQADRSLLLVEDLAAGSYYAIVSPRVSDDFAFYDLRFDYFPFTCTPDAVETRPCGLCGSETRSCGSGGSWGAWSACAGEGECEPGAVEVSVCPGGTSMRTCDDLCSWGAPGPCLADPLGAPCSTDEQCGGLDCLDEDGRFTGGYCSLTPCTSDDVCGPTGACLPLFGAFYCLLECPGTSGCRLNYVCAEIEGVSACAPRCRDQGDCSDPARPRCDAESGLCVEEGTADGGLDAGGDAADAGGQDAVAADAATADVGIGADAASAPDDHEGIIGEEGGGCFCSGGDVSASAALMLLFLLVAGRRRGWPGAPRSR